MSFTFSLSILAAFGTMFCWAFGDFFTQRTAWKVGDLETVALIGGLGSLFLLPFVIRDFSSLNNFSNLLFYILLGVITFFTSLFNFEGLKEGRLSVIEVTLQVALPVTVLLSFLLYHERVTSIQFFFMALIFFGVLLTSIKSFSSIRFRHFIEKGAVMGLIASIGWGIINYMTGFSSKNISPLMGLWLPWTIFTLMALVVIIKREGFKTLLKNTWKYKIPVFSMGLFNTLAWVFFVIATFYNKISISTAITESYPALALFLDLHFNNRKISAHQYVGAGITIISSIVLGFFV